MNVVARVVALSALPLTACVTSSNLCPSGFVYSSGYDACLATDAGSDALAESQAGSPGAEGGASDAARADGGDAGPHDASTGLGVTCNSDSDCTGTATYCLKSPTAPTSAGICSFTHCTATECTSAYACCDCTGASLAPLQAYPKGICAPTADEAQLTAFGCQCQ